MAHLPLLWLSAAFLLGILAGRAGRLPWGFWLGIGAGLALFSLLEIRFLPQDYQRWRRRFCPLALSLVLALFCLGAARYQAFLPRNTMNEVQSYIGKPSLRLTGRVIQAPELTQSLVLVRIKAEQLSLQGYEPRPVRGGVMVWLPLGSHYAFGDRLSLDGELVDPPASGQFSYKEHLARQGVFALMLYPRHQRLESAQSVKPRQNIGLWLGIQIDRLRQHSYTLINQCLPQPQAALLNGILLGKDRDLSQELQSAFRDTGTAHIIAISGFNIAILASLVALLFSRLVPRMWIPLLSLLVIGFYTVLVGAGPSVVRAAIMGSLGLLGQQLGRRQAGLNTLAFTAALMCLFTPSLPWDASFQLSFGATLGLILFAERMQNSFINLANRWLPVGLAQRLSQPVGEYFLFTLAAQAVTLPVIAWQFERFSLISLLANPLVLPAQPLVMFSGGIMLLGGLVAPELGRLLGMVAWLPLAYTIKVVEWLAHLPWGAFSLGPIAQWLLTALFVFILILALPNLKLPKTGAWLRPALLVSCAALLAGFSLRERGAAHDGLLHVTIFELNNAPVLLVQSPSGARLLLNSGDDANRLGSLLGDRLPVFDRRLDSIMVTSRNTKPLEALAVLAERYPFGEVWLSPQSPAKNTSLIKELDQRSAPYALLQPGMRFDLGSGARLAVAGENKDQTAFCLTYGDFRLFIPGVNAPPGECRAPALLLLDGKTLQSQTVGAWQSLGAQMVIYASGAILSDPPPNWIDHAARGWIALSSDGRQMWVEAEK